LQQIHQFQVLQVVRPRLTTGTQQPHTFRIWELLARDRENGSEPNHMAHLNVKIKSNMNSLLLDQNREGQSKVGQSQNERKTSNRVIE
jgi:hypothetical protein